MYFWLLCHWLIDLACMGLFLGLLSCSIDLYFCFCASAFLFWWLHIWVWSEFREPVSSSFFFLSQFCFGYSGTLGSLCKFNIFCSSCARNAIGNLMVIMLNVDCLRQYSHFHRTHSSNPRTWYISPFVWVIIDFFYQHLIFFR